MSREDAPCWRPTACCELCKYAAPIAVSGQSLMHTETVPCKKHNFDTFITFICEDFEE